MTDVKITVTIKETFEDDLKTSKTYTKDIKAKEMYESGESYGNAFKMAVTELAGITKEEIGEQKWGSKQGHLEY